MPRIMCLGGLVIAGLVFLLFLVNMIMTFMGMVPLFRYANLLMDIVFLFSSGTLGYLSWSAFRELK